MNSSHGLRLLLAAVLLLQAVPGQTLMLVATGPGDLGTSVAGAGDVNLDGFPDIAASSTLGGVNGCGYVRVLSGADGSLLLHIDGPLYGGSCFGAFGVRVSGAGDVDADGHADLLVGVDDVYSTPPPGSGNGGWGGGHVEVYSGANGSLLYSLDVLGTGYLDSGRGRLFAAIGDANLDGYDDVLCARRGGHTMSCPCIGCCAVGDSGTALIYSGFDGSVLANVLTGAWGEPFPSALAALGDVSGDGVPDFAAAGTGNPYWQDYCFPWFCPNLPAHPLRLETWSSVSAALGGAPLRAIQAPVVGTVMIEPLADVSGDGIPELLVAIASSWKNSVDLVQGLTNTSLFTIPGVPTAMAGTGDLNGDTFADFLLGRAPSAAVEVRSGANGSLLGTLLGSPSFGTSVAAVGDLNLDGVEDFAVGAPASGQVSVFSGTPLQAATALPVAGGTGAGSVLPPMFQASPPVLGGSLTMTVTLAEPQRPGVVVASPGPAVQPPFGGVWAVDWTTPVFALANFTTDATGSWTTTIPLPTVFPAAGAQFAVQAVVWSTAGGTASNGFELTLGF